MSIHPQRGMGRELPQSQVILPENAVIETLDESYGETKMKTKKQLRTWWTKHKSDSINDYYADVVLLEDHLAIVAELEAKITKLREALKLTKSALYSENIDIQNDAYDIATEALKQDEESNG